ncbi:hypothetical protein DSO57_1013951 [Entomophthora muscae]|uniref:Uncharacterized protein n=1 Tax=Entomophthora muscae TaxID=34485 RepID=A0ACC2RK84_9FUNG|nr:hypothetical protein DSO57_1013951 [Entomophthora muscae]
MGTVVFLPRGQQQEPEGLQVCTKSPKELISLTGVWELFLVRWGKIVLSKAKGAVNLYPRSAVVAEAA